MRLLLLLLLGSLSVGLPIHGGAPAPFNVTDYGAAGDGVKKDTAAIQKAIDACAQAGGGTVFFPPGKYLTGSLSLKSHLVFSVGPGAELLGSPDPADYPVRASPWGDGEQVISPLIYGEDLVDVSLIGPGTINGQGEIWWRRAWASEPKSSVPKVTEITPDQAKAAIIHGRPRLIRLVRCTRVTLDGLELINSGMWTVNPVFCEFVTVRDLRIHNPVPSPNTDGINPESCRNVAISGCTIDVGDDCVTLKSGTDDVGRKMGKPTENVTITNCTMLNGHGGVVIGSEMSGGVRNVTVSNCVFQGTQRGIRLKSKRGRGGIVEGISVNNIVMQDVGGAIDITSFYGDEKTMGQLVPVDDGTPRFRDIRLSNITARGSTTAGQLTGLLEMPMEDVILSNIDIEAKSGFAIHNAKGIVFRNVRIDTAAGPALTGDNVENLVLDGFATSAPHADAPVIDLKDVRQLSLRNCLAPTGTGTFLQVSGKSSGLTLQANDLRAAAKPVQTADGVDKVETLN
jgi:pectate lyase